jgi:hypothetical protein
MRKLRSINPLWYQIPCVITAAGVVFYGMKCKSDLTDIALLAGLFLVAAFGKKITNVFGLKK